MRVLLVDDEGPLLMTLAANLELEGFEVVGAENASQALALVREQHFDLVLTDIRMPGMNGVELFRQIRKLRPETPVILMTAFALEGLVEEALCEGAFTVLPKPFEIEHVVAALLHAMSRPIVLLVEGEDARPCATMLGAVGLASYVALDKDSALAAVRDQNVDVTIADLAIAGIDGVELVAQILAIDATIAVIAIAGSAVADRIRRVAALGAFACLSRPIEAAELTRTVARARARFLHRERRRLGPRAEGA